MVMAQQTLADRLYYLLLKIFKIGLIYIRFIVIIMMDFGNVQIYSIYRKYTVLKASLLGRDFWTLGNIDPIKLIFTPINHDLGEYVQLIDHGKFYASKTFYDPINRQQVVMGWVAEEG